MNYENILQRQIISSSYLETTSSGEKQNGSEESAKMVKYLIISRSNINVKTTALFKADKNILFIRLCYK
jgi:hypothetical protein